MVERQESEAVGRVDDSRQVLVLSHLVLEAALHPQRVEQQVDLSIGERQHGRFLPAVKRELEVFGVRTLGPRGVARSELGALVEVVLVGGRRREAAFLAVGIHGSTGCGRLSTRLGDQRGAGILGVSGRFDDRPPEVLWLHRHLSDIGTRTP